MPDAPPTFAVRDRAALLDLWSVYDAELVRVWQAAREAALASAEFGPIARRVSPERVADDLKQTRAHTELAFVGGDWGPYDASMREQGSLCAKLGIPFGAWYEVVRPLSAALLPSLIQAYQAAPERLACAICAMMACVDHAMTLVAEEYLRTQEVELAAIVRSLEERGRRLEEANAELDGFTYSVSHDLRAPLRAIGGFARMLSEDQAANLNDDGKRYLQVIELNTRKMGQLIDDLLRFARLGRKELQLGVVDMASLARGVADDVMEPGRSIDIRVTDIPATVGDLSLLRQVWHNLLSNAVKYTRPRSDAVIHVTGEVSLEDVVYRVKDNGVGYDPRYADKLFGVFQRLHAATEFEGTGVGLALVQRIVQRHGGRITSESKPGEGALFSFSLPKRIAPDEPG